jgi:hypothetical protein
VTCGSCRLTAAAAAWAPAPGPAGASESAASGLGWAGVLGLLPATEAHGHERHKAAWLPPRNRQLACLIIAQGAWYDTAPLVLPERAGFLKLT